MGILIDKLICASNENKVLYDFFTTGIYDKNRDFILTSSPSMDILISSNLERLIYRIGGEDDKNNKLLMEQLKKEGKYEITEQMKQKLCDFYGGYATEEQIKEKIKKLYEKAGYVIDTHTAVASVVYDKFKKETEDRTKTVIASTASPYKFTRSVLDAIDIKYDEWEDFALVDELSQISGVAVPEAMEEIRTAPILHHKVCRPEEMREMVKEILNGKSSR